MRASAQVVSGVVGTSFGTLSDVDRGRTNDDHDCDQDPSSTTHDHDDDRRLPRRRARRHTIAAAPISATLPNTGSDTEPLLVLVGRRAARSGRARAAPAVGAGAA